MLIRRETRSDTRAVAEVHGRAFAQRGQHAVPPEVELLAGLRRSDAWLPRLSLVATRGGEIVGHVVCTRAHVGADSSAVLGLGPIGVDPRQQGTGVGTALLHAVLAAAEALDEPLVGLLGDPGFYRRFGFQPATEHGIDAPDPTWGEHFQARLLSPAASELRGRFTYPAAFGV